MRWVGPTVVVAALLVPLIPAGGYQQYVVQVATFVLINAAAALAWDIQARTGQLSLAPAAFFGLGAYAYTMAALRGVPLPVAFLLGPLVAGAVSLGLGVVTLRLHGLYFAIATLAFAEVVKVIFKELPLDLTGGAVGLTAPPLLGGHQTGLYYLGLCVLLLVVAASLAIRHSRLHYAFTAIRQGELTARVLGVPVVRTKLLAFALSAALTGMVGAYATSRLFFVIPEDTFGIGLSVTALATAIFGGVYTTAGPVLGAIILRSLEEGLRLVLREGYLAVYGVILMLVILYLPGGLVSLWNRRSRDAAGGD
ncbi:MAG: branched-chain amino acid ABC transporter permease [Armatimonadetes bacterium]|nr:branched-chain amino acid ABC transporter permease [Armatimonadota bacterium]